MKRIAFADESGLDGLSPCYGVGVVSFDHDRLNSFEEYFKVKLASHGVVGEAKWKKITTSHGLINFALDALNSIIRSGTATFDIIVVNTALFRNWNSVLMTREDAFYQTVTLLLNHVADRAGLPSEIYIDNRNDHYSKRDEMVAKIGNNMLARLASAGRLDSVQKIDSHYCVGVQVVDLLTGAITAAHARYMNPNQSLHPGKSLAIARLAEMLGWDDLCYDTVPSNKVNVWHFPTEYRNLPATRSIRCQREPRYVSSVDLLTSHQKRCSEQRLVRKSA
jgi:Protein of unknown function (DUF3800)